MPCPCADVAIENQRLPEAERNEPEEGHEWEEQQGCREPTPESEPVCIWDRRPVHRCPRALLSEVAPWVWEIARLFHHWENGTLPGQGGVMDQPATFVDAMEIFHQQLAELRKKRHSAPAPDPPKRGENRAVTARSPVRSSIKRPRR